MGGSSELAGATLALTVDGNTDVIAAAKIPSDYVGGTNILILAESIVSGSVYNLYQSPELSPSALTWFNDALLLDNASLSGGSSTSVTAGIATGGGGGPGGNPGGGPGGDPGGDRPEIPGR